MNQVVLIGRLTRDPEMRYTASGTPVSTFSVAVARPGNGEKNDVDFIPVVTWGKLAETCANHLAKGRQVAVLGRLQIRKWQTNEGETRYTAEVVAREVQFLDRPRERVQATASESDEDELPWV
ncbi:MAG: single-stranded DNA-binding protein [Clostridiales bacterium]|nr:single-stranded DNA-binding protein [Clostridiales bacterium]